MSSNDRSREVDNNQTSASMSFDIRFMKKGKHSTFLLLPESYHAPIGLVIAHWGNFETVFNACLSGLIDGEKADGGSRDTDGWQRHRFKSRRRLFKDICSEWLVSWRPAEADVLKGLADRAGDLGWKRNLIAHGSYGYTILPHSSEVTNCRAVNQGTGDEFRFDADILKKLYHDISHMTADLVIAFKCFGEIEGPFHALPDTEILKVYRESIHPRNPNPKKRPPQP